MKRIILVIVVLSLIACKNNDFDQYLSSLNMIELPMNLDNNSKLNQPERYNQTLFKKFKQKQTNHPYGIAFKNNRA